MADRVPDRRAILRSAQQGLPTDRRNVSNDLITVSHTPRTYSGRAAVGPTQQCRVSVDAPVRLGNEARLVEYVTNNPGEAVVEAGRGSTREPHGAQERSRSEGLLRAERGVSVSLVGAPRNIPTRGTPARRRVGCLGRTRSNSSART